MPAVPEYTDGDWGYNLSGNDAIIVSYSGPSGGTITIPATVGGYSVVSIGNGSAIFDTSVTGNLVISNGPTKINNYAFYKCSGFTGSLIIPNSVTSIGYDAFYNCSGFTGSPVIPDSVTSIGFDAFNGCSGFTGSLVIPDSVTSIGSYAFRGCTGLRELTIPISLNAVASNSSPAFSRCTGIEAVHFTKGTGIGFNYGSSSSSSGYNYYGYTPWYLSRSSLTQVTFEDGITSIGDYTFRGCTSITSVSLPDSVTSLGNSAFYECTSLTSVTISDSLTTMMSNVFYRCTAIRELTIPINWPISGQFSGCTNLQIIHFTKGSGIGYDYSYPYSLPIYRQSLTQVTFEDGIRAIGSYTFYECTGLTSVTIPDSVTRIGTNSFSQCTGLRELALPISTNVGSGFIGCTNVQWVTFTTGTGRSAIYSSPYYSSTPWFLSKRSLQGITLSEGIISIEGAMFKGTFSDSIITTIDIPDSVEIISDSAFNNCDSLEAVILGSSLNSLGNAVFDGCSSLYRIDVDPLNETYSSADGILFNKSKTELIKYPVGRSGEYDIPGSVEIIGIRAFRYCTYLTSVTIPDSVTSIHGNAFEGCTSLTSVVIPDSVIDIYSDAFRGCSSLASVSFGNSIEYIWDYAFAGCSALISIVIPDSVTYIGYRAFSECYSLASVTFGNSVNVIGYYAFSGCALTSVFIPASVTYIGYGAFNYIDVLETIDVDGSNTAYSSADGLLLSKDGTVLILCPQGRTDPTCRIPDGVTEISTEAFYGVYNLTKVTIPDSVSTIREYAFVYCLALETIVFMSDAAPDLIEYDAFVLGDDYDPVTCTVQSMENWAASVLDDYKNAYTTFIYEAIDISADYRYLTYAGDKIQAESAVRDEDGYRISTAYPKKTGIRVRPSAGQSIVKISHSLNSEPSAVFVYLIHHTDPERFERIETDMIATKSHIELNFAQLPVPDDAEDLEILVKILI